MSRRGTMPGLRLNSSCLVSSSSRACWWALLASWILPSASTMSVRATTSPASTSAILRRAVSTAARCFELSNLKSGCPWTTSSLMPTLISATRPIVSGTIGTVRKNKVAVFVDG